MFSRSRSRHSSRTSFQRRVNSSRSSFISLLLPSVCSAHVRSTHSRQGRLRQIDLARRRADRLAFVQHQPDGTFLELVREPPARAPATTASGHAGIVSTFRDVSTERDQAQSALLGWSLDAGSRDAPGLWSRLLAGQRSEEVFCFRLARLGAKPRILASDDRLGSRQARVLNRARHGRP